MSNKMPEFGWEARFWLRGQIGLIGQIGWEGQIDKIGCRQARLAGWQDCLGGQIGHFGWLDQIGWEG